MAGGGTGYSEGIIDGFHTQLLTSYLLPHMNSFLLPISCFLTSLLPPLHSVLPAPSSHPHTPYSLLLMPH